MKVKLGKMVKPSEGLATIDEWRNFYIVGGTRSGKTTFMLYLAYHQMPNSALIVIDPHGELAPKIATLAPKERLIYADINNPLVINPLKRSYPISDIAEEYAGAINASTKVNAPQQVDVTVKMSRILLNALEVFKQEHFSTSYLIDFLDNQKTRFAHFGAITKTPYWQAYDDKGKEGIELRMSGSRISDRLTLFDKNEYVRAFLEGEDQFDIEQIVKNKQIVCFNLEHIPKNARHYIGNLITYAVKTYITKAGLSSDSLGVYVDEFHSFINETFDDALVSCLKRGVNFVLAHQNHAQVFPATIDIALSNSSVIASLNLGEVEAKKMLYKYYGLKKDDLLTIEKHHAYLSINNRPYYVKCYYKDILPYTPPTKPKETVNFFRSGIIEVAETA